MKRTIRLLTLLAVSLALAPTAMAQATRTWVSGVGDDVNPCSRTAPCKTFAGAISKTATGGMISTLDPGGFGAVTITKNITLDGGGMASILVSGTAGVIVNGAGINVTLRNMTIDGIGAGTIGVSFLQGASLTLDTVRITGFRASPAVGVRMTTAGQLVMKDTTVSDDDIGVHLETASGAIVASLDNVRIDGATTYGIQTANVGQVFLQVKNSTINSNYNGVLAAGPGAIVSIVDSSLSFNSSTAVNAGYPGAFIRLSGNVIANNGNGIGYAAGGIVASDGTNRIGGVSALPPNATLTRQ